MIYDYIKSRTAVKNLPEVFLQRFSLLTPDTPCGKIELVPGKSWINVSEATAREADGALWEVHREFADVQMVLEGEELCIVDHGEKHPVAGEYVVADDYQLLKRGIAQENVFRLTPGMFLLIMPEEPHLPLVRSGAYTAPHKKIVAKIHRSFWE